MMDQAVIKTVTITTTLLFIGFALRIMHQPRLFKITTGVLGVIVIIIGLYGLSDAIPSYLHQVFHPIDREILAEAEVEEAMNLRHRIAKRFYASAIALAVGILDIILAVKASKVKNEEVQMWLKLPVIFQLGIAFIIALLSLIFNL